MSDTGRIVSVVAEAGQRLWEDGVVASGLLRSTWTVITSEQGVLTLHRSFLPVPEPGMAEITVPFAHATRGFLLRLRPNGVTISGELDDLLFLAQDYRMLVAYTGDATEGSVLLQKRLMHQAISRIVAEMQDLAIDSGVMANTAANLASRLRVLLHDNLQPGHYQL